MSGCCDDDLDPGAAHEPWWLVEEREPAPKPTDEVPL